MNDPLAQYRRKAPGTVEQTPSKGPDQYVAFDAKDRVNRLKILRAKYPARSPSYSLLLDMVYSGQGVTQLVLVFTFMMVFIRGRNLQAVVTALELQTADFLQEFDPEKWSKPTDPNSTVIESIQVTIKEAGPGISEPEKWCKPESGSSVH